MEDLGDIFSSSAKDSFVDSAVSARTQESKMEILRLEHQIGKECRQIKHSIALAVLHPIFTRSLMDEEAQSQTHSKRQRHPQSLPLNDTHSSTYRRKKTHTIAHTQSHSSNPAQSNLHAQSCALNPAHSILHAQSCTLKPSNSSLRTQSYTLNPAHTIMHTQSCTFNSKRTE